MTDLDSLRTTPLRRSSAPELIARELRERILSGDLRPGTALTESRIAEAFGVSRNTLREGFAILARDGLVTQHPHRGVAVSVLGEADVHDIFALRRIIERAAIAAAVEGRPDSLGAIEKSVEALEHLPDDADWRDVVECDMEFHRQLVGCLSSPRLGGLFDQLSAELRLCLLIANVGDHENPRTLARQHRKLFNLIRAGKADECAKLLGRHLDDAERVLTSHFTQEEGGEPALSAKR